MRLVDRGAEGRHAAPPVVGVALALEHRDRHRFERRQCAEERVDLEGAREAGAHARLGPQGGDFAPGEKDLAAVGREHPGQQVDERGLAGAIRADERVAHAAGQLERDVLRHDERAEALIQAFCREH